MIIAHTRNHAGKQQGLEQHLQNVGELASQFADAFGASELARLAGLQHDIGKYNPAFQQYLLDAERHPDDKKRGPDHKGAGAVLAARMKLDPLCFLIAGHHGGLPSAASLKDWLVERAGKPDVRVAIEEAQRAIPELQVATSIAGWGLKQGEHEAELFIRLLFSCLIDADFLDTEAHFSLYRSARRGSSADLAVMWRQFEENHQRLMDNVPDTPVNRVRREVYEACLEAAAWEPGLFRLTTPTGGSKTRSSLAFALKHACKYSKQRVIYAIPFTSITEQVSDVFRTIFPDPGIVLEHHSGVNVPDDPMNATPAQQWSRLASENWDAPLIVTTTVQLFESLLSNRTSSCRKLHNIANSVIILDEVQMLPVHLLTTILDVLQTLVEHYGVTVVLCTATQPALQAAALPQEGWGLKQGLRGIREIVPLGLKHFELLKRVEYHLPRPDEKWSRQQVADRMHQEEQALCVVNTRRDAVALLEALGDGALHLSTNMCGAHRRDVLREVRRRLKDGEPCLLVSTQLIEAGVDVDFPLVLRAIGPLDRIAQAAGRCNREGKMDRGTVIVFEPAEGKLPPGPYRVGTQTTRALLPQITDMHDPHVFEKYFQMFYKYLDLDARKVQALRKSFDYPEVTQAFRMIEDDTEPVVVMYEPQRERIQSLLDELIKAEGGAGRQFMRRIHPYIVNLRLSEIERGLKQGKVRAVKTGLWLWVGEYDQARGVLLRED